MLPLLRAFLHKQRAKAFYGRFIKPGQLCFDIGANTGKKTGIFTALGAKVIAVEPQADCCITLQQNFGSKGGVVINKGVSNKLETLAFSPAVLNEITSADADFINFFSTTYGHQYQQPVNIECTTLDELIEQYGKPVFCKIDVEGMEEKVLQGLSHALPGIEFEFTAPFLNRAINCVSLISTLGNYHFNYMLNENPAFVLPAAQNAPTFKTTLQNLSPTVLHGNVVAVTV